MWRAAGVALLVIGACTQSPGSASAGPAEDDAYAQERLQMVRRQIEARGVSDPHVLEAMRKVPRHRFVPQSQRRHAYDDRPLPIGEGQTISQPYIVALMTELARVKPGDTVLEVGTGSGYQAAVLAAMGVRVYSIEIVEPLAKRAKDILGELGYGDRVQVRHGDGYAGWPEHAPFDAILVTAAPPKIPEPLEQQLEVGGRLVIPVGKYFQSLLRITRTEDGLRQESIIPVRFVPMTGKAQEQ
jgi:protein-L-isoaspartate(D-aspartate) O-methyltransferase